MTYEQWVWMQLLTLLDRAGYAIVKKPTITQGAPRKPGPGRST